MATRNITASLQVRQDTAANWESRNPILKSGEFGYDTTNKMFKIGDGSSAWSSLLFVGYDYSLSNLTWAKIAQISDAGDAQKYFKVGDKKKIKLSTNEEITLVVMGFNHDDKQSGGKAGITFGMENLFATTNRINASNTNVGGWDASEMRNTTIPTILSRFPADLQSAIKTVNKPSTAGNLSTNIVTSADKLFLFSEVEIDATTAAGYADEGLQYEYWRTIKNGTVVADRIKYLSNGAGSVSIWWLRSPGVSISTGFRCVSSSGTVSNVIASVAYGVCVGFCI